LPEFHVEIVGVASLRLFKWYRK